MKNEKQYDSEKRRELYEKNRQKNIEWGKEYYRKHRKKRIEWQKAYYCKNKKQIIEYQKSRYQKKSKKSTIVPHKEKISEQIVAEPIVTISPVSTPVSAPVVDSKKAYEQWKQSQGRAE